MRAAEQASSVADEELASIITPGAGVVVLIILVGLLQFVGTDAAARAVDLALQPRVRQAREAGRERQGADRAQDVVFLVLHVVFWVGVDVHGWGRRANAMKAEVVG